MDSLPEFSSRSKAPPSRLERVGLIAGRAAASACPRAHARKLSAIKVNAGPHAREAMDKEEEREWPTPCGHACLFKVANSTAA